MSRPIVIEGLHRAFGKKRVLDGASAVLEEGKVAALLGRNGTGKTTLFRIALDMLDADSGTVELLGRRPDGTGSIRAHVGYVPDVPRFHDYMSVADALAVRAKFFPSWDAAKAASLCRRLGLDPAVKVKQASKGTVGKLAWVCAAAHDPELFLLDEPTSGLDALVRDDILSGMIEELQRMGRSILMASHHIEEMTGLLDEVWLLADGKLRVYDAQRLRDEAARVTGRLKDGKRFPERVPFVTLAGEGPLSRWAAFDRDAADMLTGAGLLESVKVEKLPLAETLKLLLHEDGGKS